MRDSDMNETELERIRELLYVCRNIVDGYDGTYFYIEDIEFLVGIIEELAGKLGVTE